MTNKKRFIVAENLAITPVFTLILTISYVESIKTKAKNIVVPSFPDNNVATTIATKIKAVTAL
jgi:hypothetical protein